MSDRQEDIADYQPRGYTLADQFNDLIELHGRFQINHVEFYHRVSVITGIRIPTLAEQADHLMRQYRDGILTEEELRARIEEASGIRYPEA
jgi:hypothetical protein